MRQVRWACAKEECDAEFEEEDDDVDDQVSINDHRKIRLYDRRKGGGLE